MTGVVRTLPDAAASLAAARAKGRRSALLCGPFHAVDAAVVRAVREARVGADLVVVVVEDGPADLPPLAERMEVLAAVAGVDIVCGAPFGGRAAAVAALRPDVFLEEASRPLDAAERAAVAAAGCVVRLGSARSASPPGPVARLPDETVAYLRAARGHIGRARVEEALASLRDLRVLVVGDLIVDEYAYCRVSGTVTKYPVIAAVYQDERRMAGGGAAIARHARQLASKVTYVATVGDRSDAHDVAARQLADAGVETHFVPWPDSYTVTKRRYITGGYPNPLAPKLALGSNSPSTRLFEIGYMPQSDMPADVEERLCALVAAHAPDHDVVILADFGHGLVTPRLAATVAAKARWWAVNAQTNSSNFGFNRITKHPGADFVCIDELEARIPTGRRTEPIATIVRDLQGELRCPSVMITRGSHGLSLYDGDTVHSAPAVATRIVDTVGAGDAVLVTASLCRARKVPAELTVFLGSCAGAVASGIVGNDAPVRKESLLAHVDELLKVVP